MNAIFGIFNRNDTPVKTLDLKKMKSIMDCGSACALWSDGPAGLGQINAASPQATALRPEEQVAVHCSDFEFIAAGRLDNAAEVANMLKIPQAERSDLSGFDIMRIAYGSWGEGCSERMYGDWSFAAWHSIEQRLVLSRDHHGNTALYYYLDDKVFAFATSRQALLALNLAPIELDELYLAQFLTSWQAYNGVRTLHKPILRLPPSHYLTVTNNRFNIHRYWRLEDTPEMNLPNRYDYVAAFRDVFDEAVSCRLRSSGLIGVSMSGGLDSSSVAAVAARHLGSQNQRLLAFTSVPHHQPPSYIASRFNNEFPMAQATANQAGNIDLLPLSSATSNPILAIRHALQLNCDPSHGACNLYWAMDIRQAAKDMGCKALLTGALGNSGISWGGDIHSQPLFYRLSHQSWRENFQTFFERPKKVLKSLLPAHLITAAKRYRLEHNKWYRTSAINPEFSQRIRLLEQTLAYIHENSPRNPLDRRCQMIKPGRSIAGEMASELGAPYGLSVLDPTGDARVLAFTFSVPDRIFIDPETGTDRWLIREAMKGYLPDEVRLNRKRGLQASDLVMRLRACAGDVEAALSELASGPSAAYVDVNHLRRVWQVILTEDTVESFTMASNILTRGIMAGLFVNRFYA